MDISHGYLVGNIHQEQLSGGGYANPVAELETVSGAVPFPAWRMGRHQLRGGTHGHGQVFAAEPSSDMALCRATRGGIQLLDGDLVDRLVSLFSWCYFHIQSCL